MIARNRTFIKEKGFEHPKDLFRKDIANKGWRELCKVPKIVVISIVREFYANFPTWLIKSSKEYGQGENGYPLIVKL